MSAQACGLVSVSFRSASPKDILSAMIRAGLTCIEWGSDVHARPHDRKTLASLASLQKACGISCCSYGTYFRLGQDPLDALEEHIQAAKYLETNILRLWCGNKGAFSYTEEEKKALFDSCRKAAVLAEKEKVLLCLECHTNTYTDHKESAYALMQAVSSPAFRMYWQPDPYRTVEENRAYAALLAPYTEHIHVFHWIGARHLSLAEGIKPWQTYLSVFDGKQRLLLEFMPDDRLESLSTEAEALRKILSE